MSHGKRARSDFEGDAGKSNSGESLAEGEYSGSDKGRHMNMSSSPKTADTGNQVYIFYAIHSQDRLEKQSKRENLLFFVGVSRDGASGCEFLIMHAFSRLAQTGHIPLSSTKKKNK